MKGKRGVERGKRLRIEQGQVWNECLTARWLATVWVVSAPAYVIYEIIIVPLLIWAFTRADYNQCPIGVDDIRASDECTERSADQGVRLGGREG